MKHKTTPSQRSKIKEIEALETYIGTTKSEVLQKIAGDRIRTIVKGMEGC